MQNSQGQPVVQLTQTTLDQRVQNEDADPEYEHLVQHLIE